MTTYTHILDLVKEAEPPADGILSIFQDDRLKAVVFSLGSGQELSEHGVETGHVIRAFSVNHHISTADPF